MSDMSKYLKLMLMVTLLSVMADGAFTAETLKIGAGKWPPYTNVDDEEKPGFFTEVSGHVFNMMGIKTEEEEYPWKRAQAHVFEGKLDAIVGAYLNEERAEHCFYPEEPLGTVKEIFFIRSQDADRLFFNSFEDLKGKIIGVQIGAAHSKKLWDFLKKNGNYEEVPQNEHNLKKLAAGRVDYIVMGEGAGMILIKKLKLDGKILPLAANPLRENNAFVIFSKKTTDVEFVRKYSDTLKAFKETDDYKKIYKKYFGYSHD